MAKANKLIKGMDEAIWERAMRQARKAGEPMAVWVGRAIVEMADREEGAQVIPPGQTGAIPRPAEANRQSAEYPAAVEVADLANLIHSIAALAAVPVKTKEAAPEAPGVPSALRTAAFAAAGLRLREARGLPPPAKGQKAITVEVSPLGQKVSPKG